MFSSHGVLFVVFAVLSLSLVVCEEDVVVSRNILILVENVWIKETHSQFLKSLTDRGYVTTVSTADDPNLSLTKYGEYNYGHLVILAPSASEFGGKLNVREIVDFLDYGGNVVAVANSEVGEAIRELGSECGIEFDEENTHVIDHHNYDVNDDGTHTNIVVSPENLINSSVITGDANRHPFLYRGVGISSDPNNPLLINVLHASRTSYSYNLLKKMTDYPNVVGTNTQLIVALQARNNARALFIGSLDFLSDKFFATSVESTLTGEK
ncbi:hypothetical protein P879_11116 [Paragonimus westermani]|uniref:Dolichyl-diphosphooligosaccharide--protein glycosyltransferase 48 kDa subunit n=1 Tax=Paragonimus westermani TaxID=34504 RepID=A0A8T0DAQ2_9TREM|nr:hypothetical protein P879_11116 [Paragonimus westermani]